MSGKSTFSGLYKKGAIVAPSILGDRGKRRSVERREARHETLNRNRANLHSSKTDNLSVLVEHSTKAAVAEKEQKRREMLKKWKSDKDARRKVEEVQKKQKPSFRVAHFSPESISLNAMQKQPASKTVGVHASSSHEAVILSQRPESRAGPVKQPAGAAPEARSRVTRSGAAPKPSAAATKSSSAGDVRGGRSAAPVARGVSQKPSATDISTTRSRATTAQRSAPPPASRGAKTLQSGNTASQTVRTAVNKDVPHAVSKVITVAVEGKKSTAENSDLKKRNARTTSNASGSRKIQAPNATAQVKPSSSSAVNTSAKPVRATSNRSASVSRNAVVTDAVDKSASNRSHVTYERGESSFAPAGHVFVPPANLSRFDFDLNVPSSDSSAESSGGFKSGNESGNKLVTASKIVKTPVESEKGAKKKKTRSKSRNNDSFSPTFEDVIRAKEASGKLRRSRRIAGNVEEADADMEDTEPTVERERKSTSKPRRSHKEGLMDELKANNSSMDETEDASEKKLKVRSTSRKRVTGRKSQTVVAPDAGKELVGATVVMEGSDQTSSEHPASTSGEEPFSAKNSRHSMRRRTHASSVTAAAAAAGDDENTEGRVASEECGDAEESDKDVGIVRKSPRKMARIANNEKVASSSSRRRTVASCGIDKRTIDSSSDEFSNVATAVEKPVLSKSSVRSRSSRRTTSVVLSAVNQMDTDEPDHHNTGRGRGGDSIESEGSLKLILDSDESNKSARAQHTVNLSDRRLSTPVKSRVVENGAHSISEAESPSSAIANHEVIQSDEKENVSNNDESVVRKSKDSLVMVEAETAGAVLSSVQLSDDSVFRTPREVPMSARRRRVTRVGNGSSDPAKDHSSSKLFRKNFILRNKSPEEGVEILKRSPMVEMNRKPKRTTSDESSDSIPMPDFTDMDCMAMEQADERSSSDERSASESAVTTSSTVSLSDDESVEECKAAAVKFRGLVAADVERLNSACSEWRDVLTQAGQLTEEADGQIRSVIGQTEWIMAKRFKQFGTVINNCELQNGDKKVTPMDLQGYYDVLYMPQVEEIDEKFKQLTKAKESDWVFENSKPAVEEIAQKKPAVKQLVKPKPALKKPVQSRFAAFRQKLAQNRQQQGEESNGEGVEGDVQTSDVVATVPALLVIASPDNELKTFDGGFFSVSSPVAKQRTGRKSLLADPSEAPDDTARTPRRSRGGIAAAFDIGPVPAGHDDDSHTPLAKAVLKKMTKRRSELLFSSTSAAVNDCQSASDEMSAVSDSGEGQQQLEINQSKPRPSRKSTRKTVSFMVSATPDTSGIDLKYLLPIADDSLCTPANSRVTAITVADEMPPQIHESPERGESPAVNEPHSTSEQPLVDFDVDEEDATDVVMSGFSGLNVNFTPGKDKLPRRVSGFTPPEIFSRRSRGRLECIVDEADESNLMLFSPAASTSTNGDALNKTPMRRSMRRSTLHKINGI